MSKAIKLLVVEDSEDDARLVIRLLRRGGYNAQHERVESAPAMAAALQRQTWDAVVSDYNMPGFTGLDALRVLRSTELDIPFILISGTVGEEIAVDALKAGANDYIIKNNLSRLALVLERELKEAAIRSDNRRAQRKLIENEAGLRRAQLMAELAHVITGPDGSFESWSATLPQLIGVVPAQMPASTRKWLDLVHPEDRALFRGTSIEAGRRGVRMNVDYRLLRADGAWIHIRQVMEPLDGDAVPEGRLRWFNTLQDVTGQKQAAEALRASEVRHRAMFEQAAVGIVHTALDGDVQMVNPKFCAISGYTRAEAIQLNTRGLISPEDLEKSLSARSRMLAGAEAPYESEPHLLRKDGSEIWVHATTSLVRAADGRASYFITVLDDISERKRAEEDLRRFKLALDNSADIILIIDRSRMRHVDVNQAACRLLGYTREELLQLGPQDLLPVSRSDLEKKYDELIANPAQRGGMRSQYRCKDGSQLPFESTRHVLRSGGTWLIAVISRDIRERLAAETALRESEERFRSLTALSSDWFWQTDAKHRFVNTPARVTELTGLTANAYVGKRRWEVEGLSPVVGSWDAHRQVLERREIYRDLELVQIKSDGAHTYLQISGEPIYDSAGNFSGYRGTAKDITERKIAETKINRLNRVYAVLSGIDALIVRVRDRGELFREACRIAVEAGGLPLAWIGILDREAKRLKPMAWHGTGPNYTDYIGVMRLGVDDAVPEGRGMAGRAVRDRKPAIANDIAHDPRITMKKDAAERGFRSLVILPLLVADQVVGTLALYVGEAGFFDEEEMRLLQGLAGDIAFALDHLDKSERLQVEAAERTFAEASVVRLNRVYAVLSGINAAIVRVRERDELFSEACRIAVSEGKFIVARVLELDANGRARIAATTEADARLFQGVVDEYNSNPEHSQSLLAVALRGGQPLISNDVAADARIPNRATLTKAGNYALALLPIVVDRRIAGLFILRSREAGMFDEDERRLLLELVSNLAFALELMDKQKRIDYLAYYDALTGLANRGLFHERLSQYLHTAQQGQGKLALILMDVVRFKAINDSLGRQAGDALLKQVAERLGRAVDPANIARIGGDHFAIVLPEIKGRSEIGRTAESIWRDCFAQPFRLNDTELRISARAGIALFPSDGDGADTLFANAEAALQKAQETGERLQFHSREMTERVAGQLSLENKLRQALENGEFVLHYQPKVDLETRSIVGVEALIRWQSPELGLVPPMKFIPLMEETGLILEAGTWALKQAALDHRKWFDLGLTAPRVAVNVSPIQLRQRDFVGAVERAIIEGIAPTGIDLEITESLIMEDVQGSIEKLKAVRGLGVRIAIDDFGTGYSSLGYLAKLPVQTLKIDRSFVITMLGDPDTMTLVSTIISLAHSLRLKVVAEGVDAEEQAKILRLLRCDEMQGYLYSKPIPFEAMTALLKQEKKV